MNERYSTFGSSSFKGTIGNLNSPLCDLDCATDRVRQLLENYLKDITRGFDYFDINISSSGNHAYDLHLNLTLFSDELSSDDGDLNDLELELSKEDDENLCDLEFELSKCGKVLSLPIAKVIKISSELQSTYIMPLSSKRYGLLSSALRYSGKFKN